MDRSGFGRRAGSAWLGAALFGLAAATPGTLKAAQAVVEDPAEPEAQLSRLIDRAKEVFATTTPDADGARTIIAAWEEVRAAARAIAPGHPAIARADIPIASQLYNLGMNAEAREAVTRALPRLDETDPATLAVRAEGVALLGTLLAQAGEADNAVTALEDGYRGYMNSFAELAPEEITRSRAVSKSNLEFSLSQVMLQLSRVDEALEYQRASLATRETYLGPNDPDTVASIYGYAGTLRRAGQWEEAERQARIAVERAVAHVDPSHPSFARALEMLAIILSRTARPVEATDYLARALELKRVHEGADSLFFGYGIHQLATILHLRERYAEAVNLFDEAAPIFAQFQGENSPFGLGSLAYAAQATFALGREDEALERLRAIDARMQAIAVDADIAKRVGPDLVRALVRAGEGGEAVRIAARDRARLFETEDADAFALRHAVLIDAFSRAALSGVWQEAAGEAAAMVQSLERGSADSLAGTFQTEQRAALDLAMEIALESEDYDLFAQAIALATGSGIAQASALRQERLAAGDSAAELKALQQSEAEFDAADRDLLRALAAGSGIDEARARLSAATSARQAAFSVLQGTDAALDRLLRRAPVDIDAIRSGLGEGEALLALSPVYDGAYSLLVTQDVVIARRIGLPRAALVELAAEVRDGAANVSFDPSASARLANALLPPELRAALGAVETLRILAGGPLASLPFGVLVLGQGEDGSAATFLADRFALANATTLIAARQAGDRKGQGFVAFAAPTPFVGGVSEITGGEGPGDAAVLSPASYFERTGVNADRLAALPPLPGSLREAQAIAAGFGKEGAKVLAGEEASEARLSDPEVSRAEVLLFATHGLVGGELEGVAEPALVLARPADGGGDGLLTVSEIARLDLSADWVLLTACDSAAGFGGGAAAFSGLASAFRFAGGGSLLATHWQVRDDVAAFVSVETLRRYRQHGDKAKALSQAVQLLRTQSGLKDADRPDIWAPFVLIE